MGYQENHLPAKQRDRGHEVTVLTSDVRPAKFDGKTDAPFDPGRYEYGGVAVERLPARFYVGDLDDVLLRGLVGRLRELRPDVVHSHGLLSFKTLQTYRYARGSDAKLFVDVHRDNDNFPLDSLYKRAGLAAFRHLFLPRLLVTADGVLAVNPYARELVQDRIGVPENHVQYLPLGVDPASFAPDPEVREAARERLGVDDSTIVVLTAGHLEPTKDLPELVRAFGRVGEAVDPELRLVVVGDGPGEYLDRVRREVESVGHGEAVDFPGFVDHDELADLFNAADVGVWPGKLGIAAAEGISTGLPIVVPETPATDFLVAGDNGIRFPRGDEGALADAIRRYVEDPDLRADHSRRGRDLAESVLSWDAIADRSLAIYRGERPPKVGGE